jgi:hypothetical protein
MALKELKAIHSFDFYPEHYFRSALFDDVKTTGLDGSKLKALRAPFLETMKQIDESSGDEEAIRFQREAMGEEYDQLLESIFKALGYYEVPGTSGKETKELHLDLDKRKVKVDLTIERQFDLRGKGKLWLIRHDDLPLSHGQFLSSSKTLRHRFSKESLKFEEISFSWDQILNGIFSDDQDLFDCEWILVNAGATLFLVEKGRFQEGGEAFLAVNLRELYDVNDDELYRLAENLFSLDAFAVKQADFLHEKLEESAHKKAAEVTNSLRETVRESIEILSNEILRAHRSKPLSALAECKLDHEADRRKAADVIFRESIRYLYRILFMLFSESKAQSKNALPVDTAAYQKGYSVERLRELESLPLTGKGEKNFIQQTLKKSFTLYFRGFNQGIDFQKQDDENKDSLGFYFPAIGTHLFDPNSTPIIDQAHLRDSEMQKVVRKLSLAEERTGKGKKRTYRVHYAGLGLNQLGAVYEGLLSLTPIILNEKAYLLKKEKQSLPPRVIPVSQSKGIPDEEFLTIDDTDERRVISAGSFVVSPVGLERKFSASFYTPEVLTRFVVKEALDVLLQNPKGKTIEFFEELRILEPAMGSGAFLNAVIDELSIPMAKLYKERFERAQADRPEAKKEKPLPFDHWKSHAKAHLMQNCVYGVDLNGTAVELAQVSLWLNCIEKGGDLPFLDLRLRKGNSLIGAWLKKTNSDLNIPHFLIPDPQALQPHLDGAFLKDKKQPFLDEAQKRKIKELQSDWKHATKDQKIIERLKKIAEGVERLFHIHSENRQQYLKALREETNPIQKEKIAYEFRGMNTSYNELRAMMDLWCSLWFWPNTKLDQLPDLESFVSALEFLVDPDTELKYGSGQIEQFKEYKHDLLVHSRELAMKHRFFHWDLEFPEVFQLEWGKDGSVHARGGFDLVLGNPPWAPVRWEEEDYFEEYLPGINFDGGDAKAKSGRYSKFLGEHSEQKPVYRDAQTSTMGFVNFLKGSGIYPFEDSSKTNTYKYFYQRFYELTKKSGVHAMIAQDGIVTDRGCAPMLSTFLQELARAFRFINAKSLFEDVGHLIPFMTWVSIRGKPAIDFQLIDNLFHPGTVSYCRSESTEAPYRGMKDERGDFELRGHPKRIVRIEDDVLKSLSKFNGGPGSEEAFVLPIIHGFVELEILHRLANHGTRLSGLAWYCSQMFNETNAPKAGLITRKPGRAADIGHMVTTGPNLYVANPAYKNPNPGCSSKGDFHEVKLATVENDFFPDTVYQLTEKGLKSAEYNASTPWAVKHCDQYRIFGRSMVGSTTGERTLSSALVPPGASHINPSFSLSFKELGDLLNCNGLFNSLVFDFLMRSISSGLIGQSVLAKAPMLNAEQKANHLVPALQVRTLRLSCISTHYADLWKEAFDPSYTTFEVSSVFTPKLPYFSLTSKWERDTCIRDEKQRDQALCEIDAIVAILFGFSKQTLIDLYRSQFGVLQENLQDLPNQKVKLDKYHFPRYQQMAEAYDYFASFKQTKKSKAGS